MLWRKGVHSLSAFQELARGFAVAEYPQLLGSTRANAVRLKLPQEFKLTHLTDTGFGASLVRQILVAIYLTFSKDNVQEGVAYLRTHYKENNEYWALRTRIIAILEFLSKVEGNAHVSHWASVAECLKMLRQAVDNDGI